VTTNLWPILGLIAVYFLVLLFAILKSRYASTGKIMPSAEEFFLAKKSLPLPVLIGTYVGTLFSAFTIVGVPSAGYGHGISAAFYLLPGGIAVGLWVYLFGNIFRKRAAELGAFSPVEVVSRTYESKSLGVLIAALMLIFLVPYLSIQLVGMGKLMQSFSGGEIGYLNGVGFVMGTIILYLLFGGMRAVAYTDFIQGILIFVGIIGSVSLFVVHFFGDLGSLWAAVNELRPELMVPPGPPGKYTIPVIVSTAVCLSCLGLSQPQTLTRYMMARNKNEITWLAGFTVVLIIVGYSAGMILGLGGAVVYPDLAEANLLSGTVMKDLMSLNILGLGVAGILLVGVIAASMSTADSLLIGIGQVFTRDILRPYIELSHGKQVLFAKIVMVLVLGASFWLGLNPPPVMIDLAVYSFMGTAILVPVIIAMVWQHKCKVAAFLAIVVGEVLFIGLISKGIYFLGFHPALWGFVACAAIVLAGGLYRKLAN
jgi:Na+/proline symporter